MLSLKAGVNNSGNLDQVCDDDLDGRSQACVNDIGGQSQTVAGVYSAVTWAYIGPIRFGTS